MQKAKVTLLGYYGHGNAGDEWLCEQSKRVISKAWASAEFRVVNRKSLLGIVSTLMWSNHLVLGGGSLFQDKSSRLSLLYYAAICALAIGMGQRVIVLANGIGPVSTEMGRWVMRRLGPKFSLVIARDGESHRLFKSFGVLDDRLVLSTDLAFFEKNHVDENHSAVASTRLDPSSLLIGLNLRPSAFQSRLKAALSRLPFSNRLGIVAHHFQDPATIRAVFPGLDLHFLPLDIDHAKQESVPCNIVIAMRFHAIVWALWHRIPCVAIADDDKTLNFATELGIPVIDLRSLSYESDAKAILNSLFESPMPPSIRSVDIKPLLELANHIPEVLRRHA